MNLHPLLGWGYEGRQPDDLIAFMRERGVEVLVDVRLTPISRRRGFSKRVLGDRLAEEGFRYLHWPSLGNPRDNREGFASPSSAAGTTAHDRFRSEVLASGPGGEAIDALRLALTRGPIVLLCYEADQACCHRSLVIEQVTSHQFAPA